LALIPVVASFNSSLCHAVTAPRNLAIIEARVRLHLITIIASFNADATHPIAAAGVHTINTIISLHIVTIIASFDPSLHNLIATASSRTIIEAGIGINPIAIITLLVSRVIQPKLISGNAVSADCCATLIGTLIGIVQVLIVTVFNTSVHSPIATRCLSAIGQAPIDVTCISIIAFFNASKNMTIAAGCCDASV